MRSERVLLAVLLVIPLVLAFVAWPAFVNWMAAPARTATAEQPTLGPVTDKPTGEPTPRPASGGPATAARQAVATRPAPTPTRGVAAVETTVEPTPTPQARAATGQQQVDTGDPAATVAMFYDLVAQHNYGSAAQLWSPRMQSSFPPSENINQRFSQTQGVTIRRAEVISQDPQSRNAAVAVDLVESRADGARHWVGTWYLVRGPSGWLLDQPELSGP
jgi:cytoskeletal protein RodZ